MITRLFALTVLAATLGACGPTRNAPVHPDWHLYRNSQYGYQIEYPDGYDLWETGLQGERDGASISISLHEYQALGPALSVVISPKTASRPISPMGILPQDVSMQQRDIVLNGLNAHEVQYRWKATGDLAFVDIDLDGVLFEFLAGPSMTSDLHETQWYEIISTFRFTK